LGTSIIDGTVTATDVKRKAGNMTVFSSIDFQRDDGKPHSLKNAVTKGKVTAAMQPGTSGRFYCFTALDIGGVHAVRTADGRAIFAYPGDNNQKIFLFGIIAAVAWIAIMLMTRDRIPLLGLAGLILGFVGFVFMGKGSRETQAQFDDDAGYTPPA
jgi:hypothetical protein